MTDWFVGQKIVCVDTSDFNRPGVKNPVKLSIYTIREIYDDPDGVGFLLMEIINSPRRVTSSGVLSIAEPGFFAWRFRPLKTKAIEIFRKIARDVTEGAKSDLELAGSGGLR
jgi:hypothetical protein